MVVLFFASLEIIRSCPLSEREIGSFNQSSNVSFYGGAIYIGQCSEPKWLDGHFENRRHINKMIIATSTSVHQHTLVVFCSFIKYVYTQKTLTNNI